MPQRPVSKDVTPVARDLGDRVFNGLVRLFWGARQHSQSLMRNHGVTAAQLSALRVLERHGEQTHSELAQMLLLSASTISGMVDRLATRKLVKRERSQKDRRLVRVTLSPAGRELLTAIPPGQTKFGALRQMIRDLPAAEASSFLETLNKLVDAMAREGLLTENGGAQALTDTDPPGDSL